METFIRLIAFVLLISNSTFAAEDKELLACKDELMTKSFSFYASRKERGMGFTTTNNPVFTDRMKRAVFQTIVVDKMASQQAGVAEVEESVYTFDPENFFTTLLGDENDKALLAALSPFSTESAVRSILLSVNNNDVRFVVDYKGKNRSSELYLCELKVSQKTLWVILSANKK